MSNEQLGLSMTLLSVGGRIEKAFEVEAVRSMSDRMSRTGACGIGLTDSIERREAPCSYGASNRSEGCAGAGGT